MCVVSERYLWDADQSKVRRVRTGRPLIAIQFGWQAVFFGPHHLRGWPQSGPKSDNPSQPKQENPVAPLIPAKF